MPDIIVKKQDEAYMQVFTDRGIEQEINEHFTFYVPGYKFMPSYKNKMWDGKIRLFDSRTKQMYAGLLEYLIEFAEMSGRGYSINFEGFDDSYEVAENELAEFIKSLTLSVGGTRIEPRSYQFDAIRHALSVNRALLVSPTASGKSLIIYAILRWYLQHNEQKALIIVPTTSLVEQLSSDFDDYAKLDDSFSSEVDCHKIYSGKEKMNFDSPIVITTWQSVYKLPHSWFDQFGCVIGDEAHTFKAKSLTSILTKLSGAKLRIGTTGTLDGTQTHQLVLEGLFGPVSRVITTKELIDSDALAQLEIKMLLLKYSDAECKDVVSYKYNEEIDFIVSHPKRNNLITNLAVDQEGNTLVLFQLVEKHGKPLYDMIKEKAQNERTIFYVSGETDTDKREAIRSITEKESNAIIVASLGTFSTGVNIRNLHNIIFASPSKSQIKVLQSIGRGLRKAEDGRPTTLYDIADDLHWKSKKNYTLNHGAERIKIYSKEKFNYNIYEVEL